MTHMCTNVNENCAVYLFAKAYALGGINVNNQHPHYHHQTTHTGECCPSSSSLQSLCEQDEGKKADSHGGQAQW